MLASSCPMKAPKQTVATASFHAGARPARLGAGPSRWSESSLLQIIMVTDIYASAVSSDLHGHVAPARQRRGAASSPTW